MAVEPKFPVSTLMCSLTKETGASQRSVSSIENPGQAAQISSRSALHGLQLASCLFVTTSLDNQRGNITPPTD